MAELYLIHKRVQKDYPDVVKLVTQSSALATRKEKQNRFTMMSTMTPNQIAKLKEILTKEKVKISEIENLYK